MYGFGAKQDQAADEEVALASVAAGEADEPPACADGAAAGHSDCGAASYAACSRLFGRYPLAVADGGPGGQYRSMMLMRRAAGAVAFFTLSQDRDDRFVIRPLHAQDQASHEIQPGAQVPHGICQVLADGMPVPRDRAFLGWVADRQVTAVLPVQAGPSTADGDPAIRVMPMSCTTPLDWPPFAASPLRDGRLWDYVERGQLVDITALLTQRPGQVFRVPSPHGRSREYIVVSENLQADEYWLPASVYVDHWWLREGIQPPPADQLLTFSTAVDLATET